MRMRYFENPTKEEAVELYEKAKTILKQDKVSLADYSKNGGYPATIIKRLFGSWNSFLEKIEEPLLMHKNICDEEIIEKANQLYNKHGKLTAEIMRREGYSQKAVDDRFLIMLSHL